MPKEKRVLTSFQRAITPEQTIPELGSVVIAACPKLLTPIYNKGIMLYHPGALKTGSAVPVIGDSTDAAIEVSCHAHIAIYGAQFEVTLVDNYYYCLHQPQLNGETLYEALHRQPRFAYVTGHRLLRPIPPLNHAAYQPVRYIPTDVPHFINEETGEPIIKADIVVLMTNPNGLGCKAYAIPDASRL